MATSAHMQPKRATGKQVKVATARGMPRILQTMALRSGTQRYAAGKILVATAERYPLRAYPHFDAVASLLQAESNIIKWCALRAIAALAGADSDGKIPPLLDAYLAFIRSGKLIGAANAIAGAGRIAREQQGLRSRIVAALLEVERLGYETPECRNVAVGHVLDALAGLSPAVRNRPEVLAFIRRQQSNSRAAVARRARAMVA